ncbi:crossover junction endodeoxyribonuclease RuvC [candidate division WWE3 bacterium]|uniref:Crossover junction endodeoxyribonuclease RuvC n=1 Tax=candidate division WWE3 bacterium TaxID=2053526 RepID=A0A7X9E6S8_UNCKA|nr:crossover junction endodeoxyribonuclease RuvC [candidate division WWE3 bacterium]
MIILGIDPGTARMGYGVIKEGKGSKLTLIESDVLVTHPDLTPENRLKFLFNNLNSIIKKHKPDVMVIERLFFNTNAKTAIAVGQARGICMLAAANRKVKVCDYTALEAKLVLTGYGRSDKKAMQEAVKNVFHLNSQVKSDDANDAVAMALCYVKKNGIGKLKAGESLKRKKSKRKDKPSETPSKKK